MFNPILLRHSMKPTAAFKVEMIQDESDELVDKQTQQSTKLITRIFNKLNNKAGLSMLTLLMESNFSQLDDPPKS